MGVNNLWSLLSACQTPLDAGALRGKRVAIDASVWIQQAARGVRARQNAKGGSRNLEDVHMLVIYRRILRLLEMGARPVFVFDGRAPAVKRRLLESRRKRRLVGFACARQAVAKMRAVNDGVLLAGMEDGDAGSSSSEASDVESAASFGDMDVAVSSIDIGVVTQLPYKTQRKILRSAHQEVQEDRMARSKAVLQGAEDTPESFSSTQMAAFLAHTQLRVKATSLREAVGESFKKRLVESATDLNPQDGVDVAKLRRIRGEEDRYFYLGPRRGGNTLPATHPQRSEQGADATPPKQTDETAEDSDIDDDDLQAALLMSLEGCEDSGVGEEGVPPQQKPRTAQVGEGEGEGGGGSVVTTTVHPQADLSEMGEEGGGGFLAADAMDVEETTHTPPRAAHTEAVGGEGGFFVAAVDAQEPTPRTPAPTETPQADVDVEMDCGGFFVEESEAPEGGGGGFFTEDMMEGEGVVSEGGGDDGGGFFADTTVASEVRPVEPGDVHPALCPLEKLPAERVGEEVDEEDVGGTFQTHALPAIGGGRMSEEGGGFFAADAASPLPDAPRVVQDPHTAPVHNDDTSSEEWESLDEWGAAATATTTAVIPAVPPAPSSPASAPAEPTASVVHTKVVPSSNVDSIDTAKSPPAQPEPALPHSEGAPPGLNPQEPPAPPQGAAEVGGESASPGLEEKRQKYLTLQEAMVLHNEKHDALRRVGANVAEDMVGEMCALLDLFGLPYLTSPGEADSQLGWLSERGLVDVVATEDSDVFLFGATNVVRGLGTRNSTQAKQVLASDLCTQLGLGKRQLVALAMLVGSDYTEGLRHVGINAAQHLLLGTHVTDAVDDEEYVNLVLGKVCSFIASQEQEKDTPRTKGKRKREDDETKSIFERVQTHALSALDSRKQMRSLDPHFPNENVIRAYLSPVVEESAAAFEWSKPLWGKLAQYGRDTLGIQQADLERMLHTAKFDMAFEAPPPRNVVSMVEPPSSPASQVLAALLHLSTASYTAQHVAVLQHYLQTSPHLRSSAGAIRKGKTTEGTEDAPQQRDITPTLLQVARAVAFIRQGEVDGHRLLPREH